MEQNPQNSWVDLTGISPRDGASVREHRTIRNVLKLDLRSCIAVRLTTSVAARLSTLKFKQKKIDERHHSGSSRPFGVLTSPDGANRTVHVHWCSIMNISPTALQVKTEPCQGNLGGLRSVRMLFVRDCS